MSNETIKNEALPWCWKVAGEGPGSQVVTRDRARSADEAAEFFVSERGMEACSAFKLQPLDDDERTPRGEPVEFWAKLEGDEVKVFRPTAEDRAARAWAGLGGLGPLPDTLDAERLAEGGEAGAGVAFYAGLLAAQRRWHLRMRFIEAAIAGGVRGGSAVHEADRVLAALDKEARGAAGPG